MIQFSNLVTNWVSATVLGCRTISARKRCVTKFVHVMEARCCCRPGPHWLTAGGAQRLQAARSFDALYAVNGGLQGTAVHRLTHTMGELKSGIVDLWKVRSAAGGARRALNGYAGDWGAAQLEHQLQAVPRDHQQRRRRRALPRSVALWSLSLSHRLTLVHKQV
jgi:hypothetical protein